MLEIDGSSGSGGGAILRVSSALSAVTGKPIRISNIRKGRPKPGLKNQHLEGLKALARLCNAGLEGAEPGSTEIGFVPGEIRPGTLKVPLSTAGSIGLVFQTLKLPACMAGGRVEVLVEGGATFGRFAPPVPYTRNVLLPALEGTGYRARIEVLRHGFFPVGGARASMAFEPCGKLSPLVLEKPLPGKVQGISIASVHLQKAGVAERQAAAARRLVLEKLGEEPEIRTLYVDSACPGSGIVLWRGPLGSDSLGERGKPAEGIGKEAAESLVSTINSGASVDGHLSDQLLPFMALARGRSSITVPRLTGHARTNMEIIRKFLDVDFTATEADGLVRIECSGSS